MLALGLFFIAAGANHFLHTPFYMRIVPPYLPEHRLLVQLSGIFEIVGGIGVLISTTRRIAGIGLIALLIAVFPANLQMALHPAQYADIGSAPLFYLRLPLQLVLLAWVWRCCLTKEARLSYS